VVVEIVELLELVGGNAERLGIAVVFAVNATEPETPVDMVALHRIGQPLDIERGLVELEGIGALHVADGKVGVLVRGRCRARSSRRSRCDCLSATCRNRSAPAPSSVLRPGCWAAWRRSRLSRRTATR